MEKLRVKVQKSDRRVLGTDSGTDLCSGESSSDSDSSDTGSDSSVEVLGESCNDFSDHEDRKVKKEGDYFMYKAGLVKSRKAVVEHRVRELKRRVQILEDRISKRRRPQVEGRDNLVIEFTGRSRKVKWGKEQDGKFKENSKRKDCYRPC